MPSGLCTSARAFLAAVADDRIPSSDPFLLGVRRDLEGEGFGVFDLRPAVEADARMRRR